MVRRTGVRDPPLRQRIAKGKRGKIKKRKPLRRPIRKTKPSTEPALAFTRGRRRGGKKRKPKRPTRVEVISPSGKIITVSSRSRLARGRKAVSLKRLARDRRRVSTDISGVGRPRPQGQLLPVSTDFITGFGRPRPTTGVGAGTRGTFSTKRSIRGRPILQAGIGLGRRRKRQEARGQILPPDQLGFFSGDALPRRTFRGRATDFDIF